MKSIRFSTILLLFVIALPAFAGGPLYSFNGKAVRYQSNVITYKTDRGPLGIFTSTQARTLADESFLVWENVASSNVAFQHTAADTLPVDVNETNYLQYTTLTDFKYDGINPIIFDSDGAITDDLFGVGASESVIGFAGSGDANNDGYYDEGEAIMNGVFADGGAGSFTLAEWKATFVHEFGHFLGLDHTQINIEFENDAAKTIYIPTMYPFATINDTPLGDVNPDDIAAISTLYPEPTFASSTTRISGSVTRVSAAPVRGANVVAISAGSDSLMNRISTVTDYFEQNTGNYTISGLAPGSYYIRIEPIDPNFTEGSSVGPYSWEPDGLSFVNPVSVEYYNDTNESGDPAVDDPNQRVMLAVPAGNVTGINFIANGKPAGAALVTEDFNFSGLLSTNGWSVHSGTTNALGTTTGLTYTGYSGNSGNAVLVNNLGGEDVNRSLTSQSENGTEIFLSAVVNVKDTATARTGDYFLHLGNATSSTTFTAFSSRLFVRIVGNNINFGVSNTSTPTYSATNFSKNTTYLLIMKYTINSAGNDEVKLWVVSSGVPSSEQAAGSALVTVTSTAGQDAINAIGIRQGNTNQPQLVLDGITVGGSWPGITTGIESQPSRNIPSTIELMQNYPNPFNPSTVIRFGLPNQSRVKVRVFDLLGKEIATIADRTFSAGRHEVQFNASRLSSGVYFYSLETEGRKEMKRMILLK